MVDVVIELARKGVLCELLHVDSVVFMGEAMRDCGISS